jgi:hypothetical protein
MHSKDVVYTSGTNEFTDGAPEAITMHYEGDYSGDVIFIVQHPRVMNSPNVAHTVHGNTTVEVRIPYEVIRDLVADDVRAQLIRNLEQMESRDILLGRHHEAR